jgi:site-specific recombinase XerD
LDPATGAELGNPAVRWLLPPSVVPPLPTPTRAFLRTKKGRRARDVVLALHRWLIFKQVELGGLTRLRIARFLECPERRELTDTQHRHYEQWLCVYLRWLWSQRLVGFELTLPPFELPARRSSPRPPRVHEALPAPASAFLASLRPTLKASTCAGYANALRRLYQWLDQHRLAVRHLSRHRLEPWFRHLHELGLAPATRLSILFQVRVYLHWLAERQLLRSHPEDLIRRTDLPRLPIYLPRPLLPDTDRELQARLAQAEAPYAMGLLLMRRSGMRVGELLQLEHDCLRSDGLGHWYLKVPLGKLNTERLVPLDDETVALVRRLQADGVPKRRLLLGTARDPKPSYVHSYTMMRAISAGLQDAAPITTHRLRHTYATEMLNAGMSLVGVMRLLGHRDYRMTLRYAAITQETLGKEYYEALKHVADRYDLPPAPARTVSPDPRSTLRDVARWIRKQAPAPARQHALLARIARLQHDLVDLGRPRSTRREHPR